jgi:hypothetical protein
MAGRTEGSRVFMVIIPSELFSLSMVNGKVMAHLPCFGFSYSAPIAKHFPVSSMLGPMLLVLPFSLVSYLAGPDNAVAFFTLVPVTMKIHAVN